MKTRGLGFLVWRTAHIRQRVLITAGLSEGSLAEWILMRAVREMERHCPCALHQRVTTGDHPVGSGGCGERLIFLILIIKIIKKHKRIHLAAGRVFCHTVLLHLRGSCWESNRGVLKPWNLANGFIWKCFKSTLSVIFFKAAAPAQRATPPPRWFSPLRISHKHTHSAEWNSAE